MRILLTGSTGQLGFELARVLPSVGDVLALGRSELDLASPRSVRDALARVRPDLIVNAAAYTDVEAAEDHEDDCRVVNEHAPALLAEYCERHGAALVHYSTDYVFDGESRFPYRETDPTGPLNAYGRSKLAGEQAILASGAAHLIFRCSWLYSDRGRNFVRTILRLARERRELAVVDDQVGCPTWVREIAIATARVLHGAGGADAQLAVAPAACSGVYHLCSAGAASWYELALHVLTHDPGRREHICEAVIPVTSSMYGSRVARPAFSVLCTEKTAATFGIVVSPWRDQLAEMMRNGPSLAIQQGHTVDGRGARDR